MNVYAPAGDRQQRTSMFNEINSLLDDLQIEAVILAGDLNCFLDPILDQQKITKNTTRINEPDQMALRSLLIKHNLIDSWRRDHPESNQCTYGLGQGPEISRLDRFYVSESIAHLIEGSSIITNKLADHNPIHIRLSSPSGLQSFKYTWKLNCKILLQQKFKEMVRKELSRKVLMLDQSN
jgi:exonuclease III